MSQDLEEKFVADDGVSTVPDTVTPSGGEIKKKRADVKKKVDPTADELEATAPGQSKVKEEVEEEISIDESISSMFEGMDLSEDFRSKVTMVFEAAVNEAAAVKAETVDAELEEQLDMQLEESIE